jgi:Tfp pilus assembly PilM family ATPase
MSALKALAARLRPAAGPSSCGLIGVHFSEDKLHMVQLERSHDGVQLRASASLPLVAGRNELLASTAATRTLIRRALKGGRFRGRRVISTLPLEHVKLMSISYPAVSPDAEPAAIANLMADRVEGQLSDYVIDYVPVRTSIRDGERLCIVAISRRERVIAYLDALTHAGLSVEALEVAPLSVRRLIESMSSSSNIENVLAINTSADMTYLTLVSGRRLLSNQEVEFGELQLISAIARALDIPTGAAQDLLLQNGLRATNTDSAPGDTNADLAIGTTLLEIVRPEFVKLVNEIERAFLYAASESYGTDTRRICLFGGLARWDGADELLSSLVNIPVDRLRADLLPFNNPGTQALPDESGEAAAELAIASGLALWGFGNDD